MTVYRDKRPIAERYELGTSEQADYSQRSPMVVVFRDQQSWFVAATSARLITLELTARGQKDFIAVPCHDPLPRKAHLLHLEELVAAMSEPAKPPSPEPEPREEEVIPDLPVAACELHASVPQPPRAVRTFYRCECGSFWMTDLVPLVGRRAVFHYSCECARKLGGKRFQQKSQYVLALKPERE